jgi:hypothetical protein
MNRPKSAGSIFNRRTVVKSLAAAAAGASILSSRQSRGAGLPHLDVKDPAAVKLGYVENANQVDAKKYPAYAKGSRCDNCLLLQGAAGADYRPCELFPGKSVSVHGWCSGWSAEI